MGLFPAGSTTRLTALRAYLAKLDPSGARTALLSRNSPTALAPGDVVSIATCTAPAAAAPRPAGTISGVVIGIRRRGVDSSILVRNVVQRVGVEHRIKVFAPTTAAIEVLKKAAPGAFRRNKLYYLRENPGKVFAQAQKSVQASAAARRA